MTSPSRTPPWRVLGWIAIFIGAFLLAKAVEEWRYEHAGARATGTVVARSVAAGARGRSSYRVVYRFSTPDGRTVQGTGDVPPDTYQRLREGGPIEIEYLPHSPETSQIAGRWARATTFGLLGGGLVAGGVVLIRTARRR